MATNHLKTKIFVPAILVTAMLLVSACGPALTIRHQDPTHPAVNVTINGKNKGQLEFDEEDSFSVSRGVHKVNITPSGGDKNLWTEDGNGWEIWVDKDAELVLLPPVKK